MLLELAYLQLKLSLILLVLFQLFLKLDDLGLRISKSCARV